MEPRRLVSPHLIRGKLAPPPLPDGLVDRPRVLDHFVTASSVTLVSALPGYGKTAATRQWIDQVEMPVAWMSLDLLDHDPVAFWAHVLAALREASTELDDEPGLLLYERGADDLLFLTVLIAQLTAMRTPIVLVLDGLAGQLDHRTLDALAMLIERTQDRLRVVITCPWDPALPLGRWHSAGTINEIRHDVLRLTDDEAVEMAQRLETTFDSDDEIVEWNHRVDGWPVALRMALLSSAARGRQGRRQAQAPDDDRALAAYLVNELLEVMDEVDREAALSLSVLERFDPDLCHDLLGSAGTEAVRRMLDRGMFLSIIEPRAGVMQFHGLFRKLMELELGQRDPARRVDLHRRAARLWADRGNLRSAYGHLEAIEETSAAFELLVGPAMRVAERGDVTALRVLAEQLPTPSTVNGAQLAVEFGTVALFAEHGLAANHWCERAGELLSARPGDLDRGDGGDVAAALHDLRTAVALLEADVATALSKITARAEFSRHGTGPLSAQFAIVASRALLATHDRRSHEWVDAARRLLGPPVVVHGVVPSLQAEHEWLFGSLREATVLSEAAVQWLDDNDIRADHLAFDSFVTAGWCRLALGDLDRARRIAARATSDAKVLGSVWAQLRSGCLTARLLLARGEPIAALHVSEDLVSMVPPRAGRVFADRLVKLSAEAALCAGRFEEARAYLAELPPGPPAALIRIRLDPLAESAVAGLLADRHTWPTMHRLDAELTLATGTDSERPTPELVAVVEECARSGWVLPFLGRGARFERRLRTLPLERVHPQLASVLDLGAPDHSIGEDGPRLTSRELTILELLPTHLTYGEIGERLFLSVNTVKSNLKAVYRKLDARTRAEAVAAGRANGLL